jgi:lysophospholipase L1-like esterase
LVGREISLRKPPNTRRLAMVGASLTAGQGVPYRQTFPALLEDRLNTVKPDGPDERFEVLNFSTISYTLPQIVDTAIEDAPRFEPDVYLLDLNELAISAVWGRHLVQLTQLGIDAKYDFLRDILHQAGVSRTDSSDALYGKLAPYRIAMLRGSLRALEAGVASHHASLIVLLMTSVEAGDLSKRRMETISELIRELHAPVVDLMDSFDQFLDRSQLAAYPGDVHFNHRGHALVAENLYRKLRAQPDAWAAVVGPQPVTIPRP